MSKSLGNTVNPFEVIAKYGADTTRWYLVTTSPPWRTTMFNVDDLVDVQRKFFGTLISTYAFFALYANIDNFEFTEARIPVAERQEIDRWILSELNSLIKRYTGHMEAYPSNPCLCERRARARSRAKVRGLAEPTGAAPQVGTAERRPRSAVWGQPPGLSGRSP